MGVLDYHLNLTSADGGLDMIENEYEQDDLFSFCMDESVKKAHSKKQSSDWKWTMKDDYPKETNGLKVFSCFACGGEYNGV